MAKKEITIAPNQYGTISVHEFGIWPKSSVLSGQTKKVFLAMFDTMELATEAYPKATIGERSAHNTFDHL
jgi:hypothetical protein